MGREKTPRFLQGDPLQANLCLLIRLLAVKRTPTKSKTNTFLLHGLLTPQPFHYAGYILASVCLAPHCAVLPTSDFLTE